MLLRSPGPREELVFNTWLTVDRMRYAPALVPRAVSARERLERPVRSSSIPLQSGADVRAHAVR